MKWATISARFTTYALTVWPTFEIGRFAHLTPAQFADLNCFIFYGLQIIITALTYYYAAKIRKNILIYPASQTIIFSLLCWGFPSELLLAPGMLWGILLLATKKDGFSVAFLSGFAALVFTHELALPAALIAGVFAAVLAWRRSGINLSLAANVGAMVAIVALMFWVRASGGGAGSDGNALYVFDPRRSLANPELVLILAAGALAWRFTHVSPRTLVVLTAIGVISTLASGILPWTNFDAPRYGARTLLAISMVGYSALFVVSEYRRRIWNAPTSDDVARTPSPTRRQSATRLSAALALILGIQAGALVLFVWDWSLALSAEQRLSASTATAGPLTISQAPELWTPREREASTRLQLEWATPYRQYVTGGLQGPKTLIYDDTHLYRSDFPNQLNCNVGDFKYSGQNRIIYPPDNFFVFACSQPKPPRKRLLSDKALEFIRKALHF